MRVLSGGVVPYAGFVSRRSTEIGRIYVRVKLTLVCFKSILAKGLRAGAWFAVVPFVSLAGLSGGGVASCGIGLKLLQVVSCRFQYAPGG